MTAHVPAPDLGINGLDHVRVLVRDLEAAKDCFRDTLGFRIPPRGDNYRHPLGSHQTVTRLSDVFYLELLAVHDRAKMSTGRPEMVRFLDRHEGGHSMLFNVRSAQAAADALQRDQLAATAPIAGGFEPSADPGPLSSGWWLVNFNKAPFTKEALSLIEYHASWEAQQAHARTWTDHPNGATQVRAVWLVVPSIELAARHFARLGLAKQRTIDLDRLAARACEIHVSAHQHVLLMEPIRPDGEVRTFLTERGGAGVMGITLGVNDLDTCAARLTRTMGHAEPTYAGRYGRSLLVPGSRAHGIWLEFVERST